MDKAHIYEELRKLISKENIKRDFPMKYMTSFKIGGPADFIITPRSMEEVRKVINFCRQHRVNYFVMGNGTNLLVKDGGFRGIIVKFDDNFDKTEVEGERIIAESGILLSFLSRIALKEQLSGLEFASGIPGTLGGAIAMNAGAYGYEMKDVVEWVELMDEKGPVFKLSNEEMGFGYRKSIVQEKNLIVLKACMKLKKGDYTEIKNLMDELNERRRSKQPLFMPSAGSVFKRPEGHYAGKLIEEAGLKGYRIGDAQVSEMHSGFIVNLGKASAKDVLLLIEHIRNVVKEKFGIWLEPEIKIIGED